MAERSNSSRGPRGRSGPGRSSSGSRSGGPGGGARGAGSRAGDERQNEWIKDLAANQDVLRHIDRLHEVAEEVGCTLGQLSLAWILQKDGITSCITGATRPSQIEENCKASGIELSADQMSRIDEIIMPATFSHDFH